MHKPFPVTGVWGKNLEAGSMPKVYRNPPTYEKISLNQNPVIQNSQYFIYGMPGCFREGTLMNTIWGKCLAPLNLPNPLSSIGGARHT